MILEKALEITMIRNHELPRINITVLNAVIEREKSKSEGDYILHKYSRSEYIEAYETILHEIEIERGI